MPFHWQSHVNVSNVGVQDMVLLGQLSDEAIVENLRKRLAGGSMFTYIGDVLISVNPFQQMPYFSEKEIEQYQSAAQYENPPHIYAIADTMYRNILVDNECQCVIISGESGAGKTVCAKLIMNYITRITSTGGNKRVQRIKEIVLKSNPLLEAFGNAATVRNWNSSRFGKYVEIKVDRGGRPVGGHISNFLLEKSRVVSLSPGERSFHIFYQMLAGADAQTKRNLGLSSPDYYAYLASSNCYQAEGTDDRREFAETLSAMTVVGISDELQLQILHLVSAVLHIGNISFVERKNFASVADEQYLKFPSHLLGISQQSIKEKLTTRLMSSKWGHSNEEINVCLNVEQATYTRDAWAKALYARLFDFMISTVNHAMAKEQGAGKAEDISLLSIGILDIYGFEIFERNGFEQFCINFVNEKLQQIFIELTLKTEQEEYVAEGIAWTPIDYFNNKIVCDLIESKNPPGVMPLLDDICTQIHGQSDGVDEKFLVKLGQQCGRNEHFKSGAGSFLVTHYAGPVQYDVAGFCDRNRDILYPDLVQLMQSSTNKFIRDLFSEDRVPNGAKSKPTSASLKIRTQANKLVESLMRCSPHYIRCIKPNEHKRALEFDSKMVLHQVHYLGLRENIRVRRAGYAYRRPFDKFIWRYAILSPRTWPLRKAQKMPPTKACEVICQAAELSPDQFQLGRSKVFVKNPESLFLLEEARERKFDAYARVLQKAFRRFTAKKRYLKQKELAHELFAGKKERRRLSLNRNFVGDYLGLENRPALQAIVGKRERIEFAHALLKYDRRFMTKRVELLLTSKAVLLVGREEVAKGPNKGKMVEVLSRSIPLGDIERVVVSPFQDDFILLNVRDAHSTLIETPLKTEFLTSLNKVYKEQNGLSLPLDFKTHFVMKIKRLWMDVLGDPEPRHVNFVRAKVTTSDGPLVTKLVEGKILHVVVVPGLSGDTHPSAFSGSSVEHKHNASKVNGQHQKTQRQKSNNAQGNGAAVTYAEIAQVVGRKAPTTNNQHQEKQVSQNSQVHPVRKAPAPAPRPLPKPKNQGPIVKALYMYDAQDTDELSFQKGQIIELLQKDDSGWWQGKIGPKIGLFPANYVQEM